MSRNRTSRFIQTALAILLLLAVPHIVVGQGGFAGPSSGGPATGTVNAAETQLTYNGTAYPLVNGKVTFPDCTMYIALRMGLLIGAGTAPGCTPGGSGGGSGSGSGGGGFVGPGTGGPATGTVNAAETQLTYNGATYSLVGGKATFPDCTIYIALRSGLLLRAGTAAGCTPAGSGTGGGVSQTTPTITWANPASVVAGTMLGGMQLNATANVAGAFSYSPGAGAVLAPGTQTLSTTFTPTDTTAYTTATASVTIVVAASGGGGSGFAGPASGGPGSGQVSGNTLIYNGVNFAIVNGKVTFPDCTVYIAAPNGVLIRAGTVSPCTAAGPLTPVITWATPAPVASGTQLSGTQLNATASVAGTLAYSPAAGTVPADGTVTLSVIFTPTDTSTYATATATVSLRVGIVTATLGPSNGGPATGTVSGGVLTYNGATFNMNANSEVQLPDCKVYLVVANGALLIYKRDASSCNSGSSGGGTGAISITYVRPASSCSVSGAGPSSGGPTTGTLSGSVLTYNGATYTLNPLNQVQLPDCNVYVVSGGSGGSGGGGSSTSIPGGGPIQTWSAPKQVVDVGRVSIFGMDMAYDAATQRYLLVFRAGASACGISDAVWGQFLDSNADPLGSKFYISLGKECVWAYDGWEPAVAATGDGRFIVTYAKNSPGSGPLPYDVIFNLVEYNGGAQVSPPVMVDTGTSREATAVAWMPNTKQFMVMWSKLGPPRNTKVIYSRTITRDGSLAQIYKVTDNADFIDMATAKIAQGEDNNLMVIGWRDSTNNVMAPNGGISYTQVTESGSPLMNTANVVGPSSAMFRYPRVAYNPQTKKYLSIYTDYAYPGCDPGNASGGNIMSRTFNLNGTPMESQSDVLLSTNRCNGSIGDDQFTELGLAYEPVNNAFVIGARGQDSGDNLPVYRMVTDPNGKVYQSSVNSASARNASPMPTVVADGTGRVLIAYRPDYTHIWVMFGSK